MIDNSKDYIIHDNESLVDALSKIDKLSTNNTRILFVGDKNDKIVGSVSDGDCRRALIKGKALQTPISEIMNQNFTFLEHNKYDIKAIQKIRSLGYMIFH